MYWHNKGNWGKKWAWYYICFWWKSYLVSTFLQLILQFPSCEIAVRAIPVSVILSSKAGTSLWVLSVGNLTALEYKKKINLNLAFRCGVWYTCLMTRNVSFFCHTNLFAWRKLKDVVKTFSLIYWHGVIN